MTLNDETAKPKEVPICKPEHTMDESLTLAGTGKFQYLVIAVAGLTSTCVVIENQAMPYVMPSAKYDLNVTLAEQGFINSVGFLGVLVASHFWGFLTDTWGRYRTLQLTLFCTFIASALSSVSVTSFMLIITRFVVGASSVGIRVAGLSFLDEYLTKKNRPMFLTFYSSMTALGAILQPMIGLIIMTMNFQYAPFTFLVIKPWRIFILLGSLVSAIGTLVLMCLSEGPKQLQAMGKEAEALAVLQLMYRVNSGRPSKEYPVQKITVQESATSLSEVKGVRDGFKLVWTQTSALFKPPHFSSMFQLCMLSFLTIGVSQGMQMWFPQMLANYVGITDQPLTMCKAIALGRSLELHYNNDNLTINADAITTTTRSSSPLAYYVIMVQGISFLVINTIVGFLIKRVGKTLMLSSRLLMNTVAAIGLIWVSQFYVSMAFMILLLSTIGLMNIIISISGDTFTSRHKGMAISNMFMAGRIGSVVGSNAMGSILYTECNWLLSGNAAIMLGATVFCYFILKKADIKDKAAGK